jgi:hypothetical protein
MLELQVLAFCLKGVQFKRQLTDLLVLVHRLVLVVGCH